MSYAALKVAALLSSLAAVAVACTPSVGDKCQLSTDCSSQGDRLCDLSQPGGYCTQLNCVGNKCIDSALCILFNSATPGCTYNDRNGPGASRVSRSFCMAECTKDSDCRAGYVCADARTAPWNAIILDDDQGRKSCLPTPLEYDAGASTATAPVCAAASPPMSLIDAGPAVVYDAGLAPPPLFPDAGADGG